MIKPRDCFARQIAALESLIDEELVKRFLSGQHVTVILPNCTDAMRQQLQEMYAQHWEVVSGYSVVVAATHEGEHWITLEQKADADSHADV